MKLANTDDVITMKLTIVHDVMQVQKFKVTYHSHDILHPI